MAKAREIEGVSAEMRFASAAALVVAVRGEEVFAEAHGVLDRGDIERVHDMRVATRRLRAALEVFRACFPKAELKAVLADVKALADALGERRDRDVMIADLEAFRSELAQPDRPGVDSLIGELRREQTAANEALKAFVAPERLQALRERLDALVEAPA